MTKFTVKSLKYLLPPLNILECQRPLGVANGAITELQITASTEYNSELAPMFGRLFYWSGWSTAVNDVSEWLQIDLGQKNVKVIGAATQGRHNSGQWVTTYKLQYSDEGVSFTYYKEEGQTSDKVKKLVKLFLAIKVQDSSYLGLKFDDLVTVLHRLTHDSKGQLCPGR